MITTEPPIVSVICNAYNHEKYIKKALDGFVNQKTTFPFEVLIHDDASTDGTVAVIKEYEERFPDLIKPIYQTENKHSKGVKITFDIQYPRAKGNYIAFCEGDDYWTDDNKLQKQYDFMISHPDCSLVTSRAIRVSENGSYISEYSKLHNRKTIIIPTLKVMTDTALFPFASMFFEKKYFERHFDILKKIRSFDYIYKILLALDGNVYMLPDVMCAYRVSAKGSWTERIWKNKEKQKEHYENSIQSLIIIKDNIPFEHRNKLDEVIGVRKLNYLIATRDYGEIYKKENKRFLKYLPVKSRISLRIAQIKRLGNKNG